MITYKSGSFFALVLLLLSYSSLSPAFGFDSIRVAYGSSFTNDVELNQLRLAARFQLKDFSSDSEGWQNRILLDVVHNRWDSTISNSASKSKTGAEHIVGYFLTPVWRIENSSASLKPYFELGIGPGRISEIKIRRDGWNYPLNKSSHFQFEVLAGTGIRLGHKGQYEIGAHWTHYSNGYTKTPNYSLDHIQISFGYRF